MKLLDRFEQSMERILEGSVGSIFRQRMQPAEIGRALEKAMFDHRQVSVGTMIVPNRYTVSLHPADYAQFAGYPQGLAHQMERFLFERASEKDASVLDHIQVSIVEDDTAKRGRPTIACAISDMHRPMKARSTPAAARFPSAPPSQATHPFSPRNRRSTRYLLHATDGVRRGETVPLDQPAITVGRASDNALVIPASDVSRHHARIDLIDGVPRLEDIGSTNGTRVNGQHVRHADLAPGDRVAFGSQVFEVTTDGGFQ